MRAAASLFAALLLAAASAKAESISIAPGDVYRQNFNNIGSSGTALLPSGWTVSKSTSVRSVTPELYQGAGSATEKTGTGSENNNGIYNWIDAGNLADHGVGFLASGTQTKTGNLYLSIEASGSIPDFTISYDMKCYRNNTRQFRFQLYYSTDSGNTWNDAGSSFLTTNATSSSAIEGVDPADVISVSGQMLELSEPLSSGDGIVFCWSYSVLSGSTTSNSQGLGIDNVVIEAGSSSFNQLETPVVTATSEMDGLWLSWPANPNAYDYELQVLDPDGEPAGSWSFNQEQSASQWSGVHVEGLAESTEYKVYLRVMGDGTTYSNSSWSENTFSTIADPWRPKWNIGEPTPVPIVGSAFSFGVSAFRYVPGYDGTDPQTVAFDGLTPVPTGAQPTFANGVFSWTPGADAAGDYSAAFSVQNDGGTYSTNVAFTVKGETEEDEIFFEGFSACTGNWGASNPGAFSSSYSDKGHAWSVSTAKRGYSGMRLGNKSDESASMTPTIHPLNDAAGTVSLSFVAAGWNNDDQLTVSVPEASWSRTVSLKNGVSTAETNPLPTGEGYSFGPYEIAVPGPFVVSFQRATGDGRMGIDSVRVTQAVSTSLVDLDVPTGLAVVDGTLSTNSFSVAWNMVENATNYAVEVRFTGGTDAVASQNLAAPPAVFTALADDVSYEVRLRAEGDTSVYNFSNWTNITVKTVRSPTHATLSFDGWTNAVGNGKLYAGIKNTATVSAVRDDGTNAVVTFTGVSPEPAAGFEPAFENGVLTWTPADENTNTIFTVFFLMDGVYSTNFSFKLQALDPLSPPVVTVAKPVHWNKIDLSWNHQYRAAGYAVRAWTDCPNPGATATRVEENFKGYFKKNGGGARPVGWLFDVAKDGYNNSTTPVKLDESGSWIASYDLGGAITSVTFTVQGNTMKDGSTLRAYWTGSLTDEELENPDNRTNNFVVAATDLVSHSQTVTAQIPASLGARRIIWQYEKHYGTVGMGSVVIKGTGFSTPRWLPGWGPAEKNVGLVQDCTVAKPRPGKVLGVDPADKTKDLEAPRINYAEVTVRDAAGATLATVVEVEVPAPPRSARASMMILR